MQLEVWVAECNFFAVYLLGYLTDTLMHASAKIASILTSFCTWYQKKTLEFLVESRTTIAPPTNLTTNLALSILFLRFMKMFLLGFQKPRTHERSNVWGDGSTNYLVYLIKVRLLYHNHFQRSEELYYYRFVAETFSTIKGRSDVP